MPRKEDFPPLLADGLKVRTLEEIDALCVDAFPLSSTRKRLMAGLRAMVDRLVDVGIQGNLWIDGSFLTTKTDPDDVDIVLELSQATTDNLPEAQANTLSWFASVERMSRN